MSNQVDPNEPLPLPQPPSADQVARRALVLATVSCRGILESDKADPGAAAFWQRVSSWWSSLALDSELEDDERMLLQAPFGLASQQSTVNAGWRSESLSVLVWALRRGDIPPHDVQTDAAAMSMSLGFLEPKTVLEKPALRTDDELEHYRRVAFTVHWRLREYSLRPNHMDFGAFCKTAWFGPLSLEGVALRAGDLEIAGQPISQASQEAVRIAASIAMERHLAANWLLDASLPFSETDTGT